MDRSHSTNTTPDDFGRRLLALARGSIDHALGGPAPDIPRGEEFHKPAATFVTILRRGRVHGCIGALAPMRSLVEDVQHNAVAAALYDPRSSPLGRSGLGEVSVEISILSELEPIEVDGEQDAAAKIVPGVDGIVLSYGHARATFLPQVWEKLPDPRKFLAELRRKAGISSWQDGIRVQRYSVQKYEEPPPDEGAAPLSDDEE
jgi:hypothetical protein